MVDEYHSKLLKLEHDILLKPKMKTVRYRKLSFRFPYLLEFMTVIIEVHILSGDLILHKRTLDPIKTLIYGLRRYDLDRCAALVDTSQPGSAVKVEGFMSHKAKIYLVRRVSPIGVCFNNNEAVNNRQMSMITWSTS